MKAKEFALLDKDVKQKVSWLEFMPLVEGQEQMLKVWRHVELSEKGQNLAQQLLTTLGTLVVAIASFYFGSSSVSSAVAAVRGGSGTGNTSSTNGTSKTGGTKGTTSTSGTQSTISSVDPKEGKENSEVPLTIGQNLRIPRTVKLSRGSEELLATGLASSGSTITAKVKLDKAFGGDSWDVVVINEDGSEIRLGNAFKIIQ